MKVEIRPAQPSDADAAVPLIYSSGPGAFDYVFSHRTPITAKEFLHRMFQRTRGELGFRAHIVAVCEGEVVGTGTAYSGREHPEFMLAMLGGIFRHYGLASGSGVIRRGMQVESIVQPPKGDLHYIAHLGVSPEFRSHGVGTQIVSHLLEQGRALGRSTAALDVSVENPRAEALYERLGFRTVKEVESRFSNETAAVPSHRRMERAL